MKILKQINGAAGIFFPIGLPPEGTCNFATSTCLSNCIALKDTDKGNKLRVSQRVKKNIHNFFITKSTIEVCFEIIKEMGQMEVNILHWFMSGDCLPEDKKKLTDIIEMLLKYTGIVQNGFTRNIDFWHNIKFRRNIIFTCDYKPINITGLLFSKEDNYGKIFGIPDYENNVVELYIVNRSKGVTKTGACGTSFVEHEYYGAELNNKQPTNCMQCLKSKNGCFYKQHIYTSLNKEK